MEFKCKKAAASGHSDTNPLANDLTAGRLRRQKAGSAACGSCFRMGVMQKLFPLKSSNKRKKQTPIIMS